MDAWPRTQTSTYYGMLSPGAVGLEVDIVLNLLRWAYFLTSNGCTAPSRIRQAPPLLLRSIEEKDAKTADEKGGGVPNCSPPSPLQDIRPVVEVHDESIHWVRSLYQFISCFIQYVRFL